MTTTLRPSPLIEDCARAIHQHCMVVRRKYHTTEGRWERLDEQTREVYRGMAKACVAALQGHSIVFGRPSLRERLKDWWNGFIARHLVMDDPYEE